MADAALKGWFVTPERGGDRTLEQQMLGLEPLLDEVAGKSVLDIGCAEGLVAIELAKRGASVHGVEIVPGHVVMARELAGKLPCTFQCADANHYWPRQRYDVVLMLGVLHKLRFPRKACARCARMGDLCVIRLTPKGPVIVDDRSAREPYDIDALMRDELGFVLERETVGPFDEWMGYYRRQK